MSKCNDNYFIEYNSLISLIITSEEYENGNYTKCLFAEDDLESPLSFKLCKRPLRDYYDLMGSIFYIRNVDECIANFGMSGSESKFKKEEKTSKELSFLNKERIHQNNRFYLQHMTSKKYVSIEMTKNNNFALKLLKNIDTAAAFCLRKINEKRNSNEFLTTKEIYYLCIDVLEDDELYYVQDSQNLYNENENSQHNNILVNKNQITKFFVIDQTSNVKDSKNVYAGQLINIIFRSIKENKEEKYMLGVESKKQKFSDINVRNNRDKGINEHNNTEYRIVAIPYSNEIYDHVLNNSFWVLEEDYENYDLSIKKPIQVNEHIRIKNFDTSLYLSIKKRGNNDNNSSHDISQIFDMSSFILDNKTFEFILVEEQDLNDNLYLEFNFTFLNYMLDSINSEITDEGKYFLKGVFTNIKLFSFINIEYYYQTIGLTFDNRNNKNNLLIKNEDDFIFSIKKIDIFQGNQVNYIVKIIQKLNKELIKSDFNNYNIINEIIIFLLAYLLNIDYSFRDENYEYNVPIRERQIFLYKFNILEACTNLIDNYLRKLLINNNLLIENKEILTNLLSNIIKFFKYLSVNNEEIKQAIYIIALNKLLKISEIIFTEDFTLIINFIFELIDDSEALQDYLLDGGSLLKQQIDDNNKLSKYDICDLLRKKKLLEYIEKNYDYLLCYEKLISLNKVQYRRKEIIEEVKNHIEEVKNKDNPCIKNYKKIINDVVHEIIIYIKKHSILLGKYKIKENLKDNNKNGAPSENINDKEEEEHKDNDIHGSGIKKKRTSWRRRDSVKEKMKKNSEELRKIRMGTILGNNFVSGDLCKINSSIKPLLESRESIININNVDNNNNDEKKNTKLNKIFSFSSINSIKNEEETNPINKNTLITNETSDSVRPLKDNIYYERLKNHFKANLELTSNNKMRKSTKFVHNNRFSTLLKRKTNKIGQTKTVKEEEANEKKENKRSETIELNQLYLNKLGKICLFIKFFNSIDLENSLFIQDKFLSKIFKTGIKTEDIENPLYIFFVGKSTSSKTNSWFFQSNSFILFLLHLYNMMFPDIKSKIKTKIDNNEDITGIDIIEEIQNDNVDDNYPDINEDNYEEILEEDFKILNEYLCVLYSIYQFCINQYVKTVYVLSKITSNFYFNFIKIKELKQFKLCFYETLKYLLSKVVFIKKGIFDNLYSKTIKTPSLITEEFDLDFIHPILKESANNKRIKKNNSKIKFSNREITLIKYMFYLSKKCGEIRYLYEKITFFIYIKNLLDNEKLLLESNETFDKLTNDMVETLNKQNQKILTNYEKLIKIKTKYSLIRNINLSDDKNDDDIYNEEGKKTDYFEAFQMGPTTEVITKILRKYEIGKFFNNIIYIESTQAFMPADKTIIKIRKMREHLYQIEKEIRFIKINRGKDLNLNEIDNYKNIPNKKAFLNINQHLSQICNEIEKLFNLNNIVIKRKDILSQKLSMENKTFYKKIKISKTFNYMIEALSYNTEESDENILVYCSYLLKIFNDMKNIDCNFYKKISQNHQLYESLFLKSFTFISKYPMGNVGDKEQYLFLNICLYGIEAFLFVIKYCKLTFNKLKDSIKNICDELRKIFDKFKYKKYQIVYQILYTYLVSRILLFLNKQKNYDSYSYEILFNFIYPINKMRENISFCIETINNNSNKENIISRKNTNIFLNNRSSVEIIEDNDDHDVSISLYGLDDEKTPLVVQDLKTKILPMDLSNIHLGEAKKQKEKSSILKYEDNEKLNQDEEFIKWDDEDEFNRLSFYLNFLSVYVIYLNDKNFLMKKNNNEFFGKEKNYEFDEDFSFNSLSGKIKTLLDYHYLNINSPNFIDKTNNNISLESDDNSLINEEKIYFGEKLGPKNIDYKFHSLLLESILTYRAMLKKNSVEIAVKKIMEIKSDENNNEYIKTETQNYETSNKNNNENDDNVIFLYYDQEYIDIILLEKIFNAIELKEYLMNYCIEDYHYEKKKSEILDNLLTIKKNYKLFESYEDEEFNLCHNLFIKNNMESLIKKILKSFNSNDLIQIEEMENYLYNKMGEIYLDKNFQIREDYSEKNNSFIYFLNNKNNEIQEQNLNNKIDLITFFNSLIYIYPKYKKSICILYYKIGFNLLSEHCKDTKDDKLDKDKLNKINDTIKDKKNDKKDDKKNGDKENIEKNDILKKIDIESITEVLLPLFSRKKQRELIEDKNVFPIILNSMKQLFISIKGGKFVFKNIELFKKLIHKLDFIFNHLSNDFEKIVNFMKKPSNTKNTNKFNKYKKKLENLLEFLITFLELKEVTKEDILTDKINRFIREVIEKVIKLICILLKIQDIKNMEILEILIDFLFNFIRGPDANYLKLLFSLGFYDLLLFVIKEIDYYQLFLNFLSQDNMHDVIDDVSEIECKIIKFFIIYYNIVHGLENINEYEKLQQWYEDNFRYIKYKLKKLYYMSQKEMEKREYDINKMLLFIKKATNESNLIFENNTNKYRRMPKKNNNDDENDCIIKFDLILVYYTLYNYHNNLTTKGSEGALCMIKKKKESIFFRTIVFFIDLFFFIKNILFFIFYAIFYIFRKFSIKKKNNIKLLQDLTDIEIKSQLINDQKMINSLRNYIRELEITINNNIFKIYFPMLDKANIIEDYKEEYYKVDKKDSFVNYILSNYYTINIRAKQYVMFDKIIKLPLINLIFKNIYIFETLLLIVGLVTNLLIILSFSTFTTEDCNVINYKKMKSKEIRIQCPHLLYKKKKTPNETYNDSSLILEFKIFGIIELIFQCLIFLDYIARIFSFENALIRFKYKTKEKKSENYNSIRIVLEIISKSFLNFLSLYYMLSIIFIILGLVYHPFFNCIILLEFVKRIQLMQTVLKAMYKPIKSILITLLMFIILEYLFSMFAVSNFTNHFPNDTDTKNFLKTFMRMIDQTFKQDGGIGTYLDKTLEDNYVPNSGPAYFNLRFFFDLIFFILILLLIFQMFLSTIIDYFNETRENTEEFNKSLETQCIVCGLEREKIEKIYSNDKNAFDMHTNYHHNVFNYIYYLMFLDSSYSRDPIIETFIWEMHTKKDWLFLPKNVCFKMFEKDCWKKLNLKNKYEDGEED